MNTNDAVSNLLAAGLALAMIVIGIGPLLLARHLAVRRHREQFEATGTRAFPLPTWREGDDEDDTPTVVEAPPMRLFATDTHEMIRLGVDGLPLSEADLSARTPPTDFTVDREHLAEILQLEVTGEYTLNRPTFVEIDAAEAFMRDPLGSAVLPPIPLIEDAGNPFLGSTFTALDDADLLTTDWAAADSDFRFWTAELGEDWQDDGSSDRVLAAAGLS